ncbi:hypothetical protein BKA82DRAFT_4015557 [Pisolithus tinctorius]|nr:hypothetical protein BKA82DRAFT_4015557 [Pisolithus tinctorius]
MTIPSLILFVATAIPVLFTLRYQRSRKLRSADARLQPQYQSSFPLSAADPLVISAEVARLLELVRCLHEGLNSFSPIMSLPVELLLDIFRYVADSEAGSHSLVACSHVCRQWRVITTTSPRLWARAINFANDNGEWVAMMIQRSMPHLLDVSWDYALNYSENIFGSIVYRRDVLTAENNVSQAFATPHRVRSVYLHLPLEHMTIMVARIPRFTPNLKTLILVGYNSPEVFARPTIPALELRAPALRHLHIENFGVHWLLFHPEGFRNLRNFTLCHLPADSRLSLNNLMAFLLDMPLLQVLVIRQALQQSVPPSNASRISFSCLRTVILEATAVHTAFLLESLTTPCLQVLEVHSEDLSAQDSTADLNHLLSVAAACGRLTTYRTVEIHYAAMSIQVFGFPEAIACVGAPSVPHVIHLSLEWPSVVPWDATHIAGSFPSLPHVQCLHFIFGTDCDDKIPIRAWTKILSMYPAVQHLSVYGMTSTGLLDALLQHPTHSPGPGPHGFDCRTLLPCLRSVVLTVDASFVGSLNLLYGSVV